MENASALHTAQCCAGRINTARKAIHPNGPDHERRTIAVLLRSTWEGRRSALRGGEDGQLFLDAPSTAVLRDGLPLEGKNSTRNW